MSILQDVGIGIKAYTEALEFARKHRLWKLIVLCILCYMLVIGISGYLIWLSVGSGLDFLLNLKWIKGYVSFMDNYSWLKIITQVAFFISSLFLFLSIYKYIFLALASPLYAYISERTAEIINQKSYPFNLKNFLLDVWRGILISLKNFLKQTVLTIFFFLLSFIPVFGLFFSLVIVYLDCYYYGFSMLDYNCERERMNISQSNRYIADNKGLAIGNGFVMYLSFMLPIIGAAIIAPLSAMAGAISFYSKNNHNS